jgi:hypothetical protein
VISLDGHDQIGADLQAEALADLGGDNDTSAIGEPEGCAQCRSHGKLLSIVILSRIAILIVHWRNWNAMANRDVP